MRTYYGDREPDGRPIVTIRSGVHLDKLDPRHDIRNHSPDGFEWGYGGSGPAQLALALLCSLFKNHKIRKIIAKAFDQLDSITADALAQLLYQRFKSKFVANVTKNKWQADENELIDTLFSIADEGQE